MTGLRWRYVWRALWLYRTRTILIILSVIVGIFAFGLILGANITLGRELPIHYRAIEPASAVLHAAPFDLPLVESVRRMPEVAVAEGRTVATIRFQQANGQWHDLRLLALEDYSANRVNMVRPFSGAWPPPNRQILIERQSLGLVEAAVGGSLLVENDLGRQRRLTIAGLTHDMNQAPAFITGIPYGYVSRDTLTWLGLDRRFNQLHLIVADHRDNHSHTTAVAQAAADKMQRAGVVVAWTEVPAPGRHFADDFLPTIRIILSSLGVLALLLSGFLVVNVIGALLAQQTRQIGVMKAVGARPGQISELYVRLVVCFGLGALLLAIPLGGLGAQLFARFLAQQLNFDLDTTTVDPLLIGLQTVMGVLVPVGAAWIPILTTVRKPVRVALADTGLESTASPPAPRVLAWQQRLPLSRPVRISLRNTLRRRGRLVRTLIPLILGGALFMTVLSVRASLFRTLEQTLVERGFDVQVQLSQATPIRRLGHEVEQVPGVVGWEGWSVREGALVRRDGSHSDRVILYGLPTDSALFTPNLVAGRWLRDDDTNAVVVARGLLSAEPEVSLGATITLRIGNREDTWVVVGVQQAFQAPLMPALLYTNQATLWQRVGGHGRADLVRVVTSDQTKETHLRVAAETTDRLQAAGIRVRSTQNATEDRTIFGERFNIITVILLIMAFLLATVGSLGLMGTMSINVLERRREIGVLRAIGASDAAIIRLFVLEGVLISVLAWLGALLLSQPMSRGMSYTVGMTMTKMPLAYIFDLTAVPLWLAIIVIVAAAASLVPARSAARISVRETLAYEG